MDLRFLSSLLEVIHTGSISAAARNQGLTPAAVSQRVKALEVSLGCDLLNRNGHAAKPTEACLRLLPRLQHIVDETEALKRDLDPTGLSGDLKIGAISTVLSGLLPTIIGDLSTRCPDLNLQITPGTSAGLYERLLDKSVDAILVVAPPFVCPKNLEVVDLYEEKLGFISSKANTLDVAGALCASPYIQYDRAAWGGAIAERYLLDNKVAVKVLCELDALESIVLMVKRDMGVSLVPIWRGLEEMGTSIRVQPINDGAYNRKIQLICHRQIGKERLLEAFSDSALNAGRNNQTKLSDA